MKFGKILQQSMQMSSSAWENHWVDYKLLKKIIKDCVKLPTEDKLQGKTLAKRKVKPHAQEDNDSIRESQDEMNFFRTLRMEIKKIADFFVQEQATHTSQVVTIEQQFMDLKSNPRPESTTELMKSCVTLYKELLLLENFAVMNFCGISKILKKHDKWTGYATRHKFMHTILMKQPFATYVPLLQMIDRLEQIFMESTGSSIDQHDARRREGGDDHVSSAHRSSAAAAARSPSSIAAGHHRLSPSSSPGDGSGGSHGATLTAFLAANPPLQALSPSRSEDSVSLVKVHALRGDVWQLKEQESVDDYDGDEDGEDGDDDGDDDGTFQDENEEKSHHDSSSAATTSAEEDSMPPIVTAAAASSSTAHHSDSDAAAIAMLSMKERPRVPGSMSCSDGGTESGNDSMRAPRFKRKACTPLSGVSGKRKMSVTAILN